MFWEAAIMLVDYQASGILEIKTILWFKKNNNSEELTPWLLESGLLFGTYHLFWLLLTMTLNKKCTPVSETSSYLC